jgi:uncharacterized protein (DUF983 family)
MKPDLHLAASVVGGARFYPARGAAVGAIDEDGKVSMLLSIVRQRCPRCRRGKVFHGLMTMYERCSVCGLKYEREPGYFLGAMYASYALGLITTAYWFPLLLLGVSPWLVIGLPAAQLVLQIPLSFRYSRVVWLHLDHRFDPQSGEGAVPVPTER